MVLTDFIAQDASTNILHNDERLIAGILPDLIKRITKQETNIPLVHIRGTEDRRNYFVSKDGNYILIARFNELKIVYIRIKTSTKLNCEEIKKYLSTQLETETVCYLPYERRNDLSGIQSRVN